MYWVGPEIIRVGSFRYVGLRSSIPAVTLRLDDHLGDQGSARKKNGGRQRHKHRNVRAAFTGPQRLWTHDTHAGEDFWLTEGLFAIDTLNPNSFDSSSKMRQQSRDSHNH